MPNNNNTQFNENDLKWCQSVFDLGLSFLFENKICLPETLENSIEFKKKMNKKIITKQTTTTTNKNSNPINEQQCKFAT